MGERVPDRLRRAVEALPVFELPRRDRPASRRRPEARGEGRVLDLRRCDIDWLTQRRFWEKVELGQPPNACWLWTGAVNATGYGMVGWGAGDQRRVFLAHRVSVVLAGVVLDRELAIDHLCSVRRCVNPAHLEQVSTAENNRRARMRARLLLDKGTENG